ncbi:hypothetical protein STANM309S_00462 [Streptomyces tanashiensis]
MVLFVMLNFTSSGGIYRPELQPGFFGALHAFWNGAGFVEGVRGHVYFDGHGLGRNVLVLALWLLAGAVLVVLAGLTEARRRKAGGQGQGQGRRRAGPARRRLVPVLVLVLVSVAGPRARWRRRWRRSSRSEGRGEDRAG